MTLCPRILFLAHQSDRKANGGMESATRIFESFRDDFDWVLMTNRNGPHTQRWRRKGARVYLAGSPHSKPGPLSRLQLIVISLRVLVITVFLRPTLIHSNDIRSAVVALPAARLLGLPLVHTIRDTKAEGERYGPHWHRVIRHATRIVTLSNEMAALVSQRLRVPASKLTTIGSLVDLDTFRPANQHERIALRLRLGIAPTELAIGMVAGVFEKKGQLPFLRDALPLIVDRNPKVRLHLIGDFAPQHDAYARACRKAVHDLGLGERVVFHGFQEDVAPWLQALDLVVISSRREGLARCMIEAMASGIPVVSLAVCSANEMLNRTGAGVVVPQADFAALADEIAFVADQPKLRAAMGRAGRAAAETHCSLERLRQRWQDLYWEVAGIMRKPA